MQISNLEKIKELGFIEIKKNIFEFKSLKAAIYEDYIFFRYCGKDLPIIEDINQLTHLIKGLYNENK